MLFECRYCGKEFEKTHNRQMYCSKECSTKAKREQDLTHWKTWRQRHPSKYKQKRKEYHRKHGRKHSAIYLKKKVLELVNGDEDKLNQYLKKHKSIWLIREIECQELGLGSYSEAMYKCFKRAGRRCELTGRITDNLHIHHLNGYHWDIPNRCNLNNLIALDKAVHMEFHKIYGRKNNTKAQFEEFKKEYNNRVTLDYWM